MHRLLLRQLRKHLGDPTDVPDSLAPLLEAVDEAYHQADADRELLERSLELSSKELLEANQQLLAVVQAYPDPLILVDERGHITEARSSAISGPYAKTAVLEGTSLDTLPGLSGQPAIWDALERANETGFVQSITYQLADGARPRWYEARVVPLVGRRAAVLLREITEQRRAEEALKRALEQLEERVRDLSVEVRTRQEAERLALESSRLKSEFLAAISHELRTPIIHVIGMSELVAEEALSHQQREYLDVSLSSARMLLSIVGEILDYSKLEAGMISLVCEPMALRHAIEAAAKPLEVRARAKDIALNVTFGGDVPAVVMGDQTRLMQIVTNLVGNAVKFTDHGEISMRVNRRTVHDGEEIHCAVSDTGIGIAPEDQGRIFELFVQADGSASRRRDGVGLGLAICRKLVERMNGRLWLVSTPGEGSTFHFTMPLLRPVMAGGQDTG